MTSSSALACATGGWWCSLDKGTLGVEQMLSGGFILHELLSQLHPGASKFILRELLSQLHPGTSK